MRRLLMTAAVLPMLLLTAPLLAVTSPESAACSAQADAKGLHGADRETFRATCLKAATPAATAKPPAAAKPAPVAVAAPKSTPAAAKPANFTAKSPATQACSAQADAKGLHGAARETFRNDCLKGAAPAVAAARPAPAVPAAAKPVTKVAATPPEPGKAARPASAPGTRSPAQLAADQRIHQCGQQWQAAKAANRLPAGQTWPQHWSACSARLKAA